MSRMDYKVRSFTFFQATCHKIMEGNFTVKSLKKTIYGKGLKVLYVLFVHDTV